LPNVASNVFGTSLAFELPSHSRPTFVGPAEIQGGDSGMKSKGPVDFFLGVFLEFGAAFCLLFFLPQVPWQWLPGENGSTPTSVQSPAPHSGSAATERRISLFAPRSEFTRPALSLPVPDRRVAPALLPAESEPAMAPAEIAPLASHQPSAAPHSYYRRDLPRQYRY
jgi:hypothetical protein